VSQSDVLIHGGRADSDAEGVRFLGGTGTGWHETRSGQHTYSVVVHGVSSDCPATPKSMTTAGGTGVLTEVDYTIDKKGACVQGTIGYGS
jgi:hypothetical protein